MNTVSHGLKQLADTIEALENNGQSVTDITTTCDDGASEGLTTEFSVKIALPFSGENGNSAFTATAAKVKQDGTVQVSFEGQITDKEIQPACDIEAPEQQSRENEGDVPSHRDPDTLQEVYEQCGTFVEMKRTLGTSVTPEAVRQQMIKHGIHEVPAKESSETLEEDTSEVTEMDSREISGESPTDADNGSDQVEGGDDSTASPEMPEESTRTEPSQSGEVIFSDGGFPADLTVEELKEIVKSSQTLHEATQQLSVERDEAREILSRLDLLNFVTGRLKTKDERTVTNEELDRRIRSSNTA
jgi:hypothetical protein